MATEDENYQQRMAGLRHALGEIVLGALADPHVVEVMLNDDGLLWIERRGVMSCVGEMSAEDGMSILSQVSSALNRELTYENPIVEGELPLDGSRFEGVAPPAVERPIFAIRKMASEIYPLDSYVVNRVLTFSQAEMIRTAILARRNILVVGGTGSGKTTFCNAVLNEISILCPNIRMIILQDTRELQCALKNKVFLRSTQWTSLAQLSGATKRLRPCALSVGEVRAGGPALEMLKMWTSGHPGGVCTLHADSPDEGLTKLDEMIQEVSVNRQSALIGRAVHVVVYLERNGDGRKVKGIIKVKGYDENLKRFLFEDVV
jgi:P-type conjugative transfer ATPase TrbB